MQPSETYSVERREDHAGFFSFPNAGIKLSVSGAAVVDASGHASGSNLTVESRRRFPFASDACECCACAPEFPSPYSPVRRRLKALVADRNAPQKHVWRAQIVLLTAAGLGTAEIMRRTGKAKPGVWRWQERFMAGRRRRAAARQDPPVAHPAAWRGDVVERASSLPRTTATAWRDDALDRRAMAKARRHQRQLGAADLAQRTACSRTGCSTFKLSNDPQFAAKLRDVVGLYVDPPAHAVVLSVDEKSQIQALDRTQPGLPMKKGRAGTMTHDYKRNGTTTLFAALNVLDGTVIGRCMQRHRHQEFIRFLNAIEAQVPAGKPIHAIVDNYATHKHPKVRAWLARHPRWTFHFTPTSAPGSTPSKASSPSSPSGGSSAACSAPSSTSRPPSTASSQRPTPTQMAGGLCVEVQTCMAQVV